MTAAPSMPEQAIEYVRRERIAESRSNPRKTFAKLEELAENLKAVGILQPLVVRRLGTPKVETPKGMVDLELIFGARRLRAARLAGFDQVPIIVREMTDEEVLDAQIAENTQREDVHPLEEAEAYELLHTRYKRDVEAIAAKVGKSIGYVYARLKLTALCPEARKAFYEGRLSPSTALYVARIPGADLQKQALKDVGPRVAGGEPVSAREAARIIQQKYMLRLVDAPFSRGDAELVPAAGPCTTCPKRSGNQKELFADVESKDLCTDPKCFKEKVEATWKKRVEEAEASGVRVMPAKEAKELFKYGHVAHSSQYVDLDSEVFEHPKHPKARSLLKGVDYELTLARDGNGMIHELAPKKALAAVLRKAKTERQEKLSPAEKGARTRDEKKWASEERARKIDELVDELMTQAIIQGVEKAGPTPSLALLRVLARSLSDDDNDYACEKACRRRGLVRHKGASAIPGSDHAATLRAAIDGPLSTPAILLGLVVELVLEQGFGHSAEDRVAEAAALFGVDRAAFREQATAHLDAAKTKRGR